MRAFNIEIVTPEASVYSGEATAALFPGSGGLFQILYDHAPLIATLGNGRLKLDLPDGSIHEMQIEGGVVEVMKNKVIVLAEKVLSGAVEAEEAS